MALSLKQVNKRQSQLKKSPSKKKIPKIKKIKEKSSAKPWSEDTITEIEIPSVEKIKSYKSTSGEQNKTWLQKIKVYPKLVIPVPDFLHQKEKN